MAPGMTGQYYDKVTKKFGTFQQGVRPLPILRIETGEAQRPHKRRKEESHATKSPQTELFLRHVVPSDGRTCLQRQRRQPGGFPQAHHNRAQIWTTTHCAFALYPRWVSLCGHRLERGEAAPSWLV